MFCLWLSVPWWAPFVCRVGDRRGDNGQAMPNGGRDEVLS